LSGESLDIMNRDKQTIEEYSGTAGNWKFLMPL
jgi:hypothetical protein